MTPVTVTSIVVPVAADTLLTVPSAVAVLVSTKSVVSTFCTLSLNAASNTSVSALVTASAGVLRLNDVTVGFSVSTLNSASGSYSSCAVPLKFCASVTSMVTLAAVTPWSVTSYVAV